MHDKKGDGSYFCIMAKIRTVPFFTFLCDNYSFVRKKQTLLFGQQNILFTSMYFRMIKSRPFSKTWRPFPADKQRGIAFRRF